MKRSLVCLALCAASAAAMAQVEPSNPAGTRDPYVQGGARTDNRFDPYTQGANQSTRQDLAPTDQTQQRPYNPSIDGSHAAYPAGAEYSAPYLGTRTGWRSPFLDGGD